MSVRRTTPLIWLLSLCAVVWPSTAAGKTLESLIDRGYGVNGYAYSANQLQGDDLEFIADRATGAMFVLTTHDAANRSPEMAKLTPNGMFDVQFGVVKLSRGVSRSDIHPHVDGGAIVGRESQSGVSFERIGPNGQRDRDFGRNGVLPAHANAFSRGASLIVLGSGSLVVLDKAATPGFSTTSMAGRTAVHRFNREGQVVRTFGDDGVAVADGIVEMVTQRPGVPGGLFLAGPEPASLNASSVAAGDEEVTVVRTMDPDGAVASRWGGDGSRHLYGMPSAARMQESMDCPAARGCEDIRSDITTTAINTTEDGELWVTQSAEFAEGHEIFWKARMGMGGGTLRGRTALVVADVEDASYAEPGDDWHTEVATLPSGRFATFHAFSDCYDEPCTSDYSLTLFDPLTKPFSERCIGFQSSDSASNGLDLADVSEAAFYVESRSADGVQIARVPMDRLVESCD